MAAPSVCFSCLDPRVSVGVCVGCRTRLEAAVGEAREAKREAAAWRRRYFETVEAKADKTAGKSGRGQCGVAGNNC